ncbi:MAG: hypothetical protein MI866_05785 [Bacteroidales bacterium]|nr:hypothetical protein [Bacteroidales bacterium]
MKSILIIMIALYLSPDRLISQGYIANFNNKISAELRDIEQVIDIEIEKTIDSLMYYTINKDLNKVISFYDSSEDFIYISDGNPITFRQVKESYANFFSQVDFIRDYHGISSIFILNPKQLHCIWHGYEKVKLHNQYVTEARWTSSVLFEKRSGKWIIIQVHTSHY